MLCVLAAAVVESGRLVARPKARIVRGPVPGYARASGAVFRREDMDRVLTDCPSWQPVTLETHHRRGRPRVLLRIRIDAEPAARDTIVALARALQRATRAHAARIEIVAGVDPQSDDGRAGQAWAVFAPDGRGWTGIERDAVVLGRDEVGSWRRAAVAGGDNLAAAGWLAPTLAELGLDVEAGEMSEAGEG